MSRTALRKFLAQRMKLRQPGKIPRHLDGFSRLVKP